MPHDIVETSDGSVFVGDAGRNAVFKFTTGSKFSLIPRSHAQNATCLVSIN